MDFYRPFVHTGPDTTVHRDDNLSLSGQKTQPGNQTVNRLLQTACKSWSLWKENGAIFIAGENPYSSSGYQNDCDLQARIYSLYMFIPYIYIYIYSKLSKEERSYYCKVSFPIKEPLYCI